MFVRVHKSTIDVMNYVIDELTRHENTVSLRHAFRRMYFDYRDDLVSFEELRGWIVDLDRVTERYQQNYPDRSPLFEHEDESWLVCEEDLEIIPLYKEAISLSASRYIIKPEQIRNLLRFVGIPTTKSGVDIENHNFGYHFHYGKVKSGRLIRSNILFTFNPNDEVAKQRPLLYSEYHAEGHSVHIDVDTIGDNKRRPVYLVCCDEASKRGIKNFKRLKKEARIFYPLMK